MTNVAVNERVLVVGGSSGIGFATAGEFLAAGAVVTIVGRSAERLAQARERLGKPTTLRVVAADAAHEDEVERLFASIGDLTHVVSTSADVTGAYALLPDLDIANARRVIDSKLIAALLLAKHGTPHLVAGGSITLTSGIAAYRPAPRGSVVAAVNGALESLVSALAIELAPIRVNVISPGWVDTEIWESLAGERKAAVLEGMAKRLPVGRVGRPEDIAQAIVATARNGFISGTVVHVDGGQRLV